ncbi:MAG: homoserine kinase [Candidatus Bathyarchaeia archaeon]
MTIKQFSIYAPASIANLGPGFDVFGVALDGLGDKLKVKRVSEPGVRIQVKGFEADQIPVKAQLNSAGAVMQAALSRFTEPIGVEIEIEKGVPPGKGMGSSGASAAAAAVAAVNLLDLVIPQRELVELAAQGEAAVAGSAHADNVSASLFGGFILVSDGYDVMRMEIPDVGFVVVVPDVKYKNKTKMARGLLPEMVNLKDAVRNIGYASRMAAAVAMKDPILFGKSICDCVIEPHRAGMIPNFHLVKLAALQAGAYGCSISGGGPSVFAVGEKPVELGKAMVEAFGDTPAEAYITKPSNLGTRVL